MLILRGESKMSSTNFRKIIISGKICKTGNKITVCADKEVEMKKEAVFMKRLFAAMLCLCLLAGSNDITAPSVSLEGKSLWIAQSLPIDPWQALRAKLGLHLLITELPLMLCAVCVAAVSGLDFLHAALVVVVPMVYVVLSAAFGLFMGLKRPNLTWTSEVAPIKQGLAVFLSMFGGWVLAAGLGFLYYALMAHLGAAAFLLAATALFIVLALVLLRWLKTSGAKIYAHL